MSDREQCVDPQLVRSHVASITGVCDADVLGYVVIAIRDSAGYMVVSNAPNDEAIIAALGDVISQLGQELAAARLATPLN